MGSPFVVGRPCRCLDDGALVGLDDEEEEEAADIDLDICEGAEVFLPPLSGDEYFEGA